MDRFTLSANTLSRTVKDNRADRIEVEIGDSKQLDFKPQFKIKRWDNEVNFSIRAQEEVGATMVEEDGKVKYKGRDIEVHQYEKPDAGDDGGFEFEWVLNKKPKSNVLRTTIQHKGLDFKYQQALTEKQIADGLVRPENVIGSYAVYHSTNRDNIVGGMEYKTGKAFHIYRPHAIDADGVKVWCELDITEGELTVTVPEDFLNKASYPVVVDPTFGYTSLGETFAVAQIATETLGDYSSNKRGQHINLSEAGTLDSLHLGLRKGSGDPAKASAILYREDGDAANSHSLIASIARTGLTLPASPAEFFTFTANDEVLTADDYIIAGVGDGEACAFGSFCSPQIVVDTGANPDIRTYSTSINNTAGGYNTLRNEDPWAATDTTSDYIYSVYATYTASSSFNPAFAHRRLLL